MVTTKTGNKAELAVSDYLKKQDYSILGLNWKTRVCEIDLIAKKGGTIYFVEVKYRAQTAQGDGLAYITPKKMRQLHFAARVWNQQNDWQGDWRLLAASVSGLNYEIINLIELE